MSWNYDNLTTARPASTTALAIIRQISAPKLNFPANTTPAGIRLPPDETNQRNFSLESSLPGQPTNSSGAFLSSFILDDFSSALFNDSFYIDFNDSESRTNFSDFNATSSWWPGNNLTGNRGGGVAHQDHLDYSGNKVSPDDAAWILTATFIIFTMQSGRSFRGILPVKAYMNICRKFW